MFTIKIIISVLIAFLLFYTWYTIIIGLAHSYDEDLTFNPYRLTTTYKCINVKHNVLIAEIKAIVEEAKVDKVDKKELIERFHERFECKDTELGVKINNNSINIIDAEGNWIFVDLHDSGDPITTEDSHSVWLDSKVISWEWERN